MSPIAIETRKLGRIYKIRGNKKEKKARKELAALAEVDISVQQGELLSQPQLV